MRAFILVGGLGTRLQTLDLNIPKPMIRIGSKPFLEYLIDALKAQNIHEVILCLGYGADSIEEYFEKGRKFGITIFYSRESRALGTGGAIKNAEPFAVEDNLILNGDSYLELDYHRMLWFHRQKQAQITIACTQLGETKEYGNIIIDSDNRLLSFSEKLPQGHKNSFINGGVYIFDRSAFDFIPPEQIISVEKDTFPKAVKAGRCYSFLTDGYFIDIGTPERLQRAQLELRTKLTKDSPQ